MKLTIEEKELRKQQRKQDKYNKEHKLINGLNYKICSKHYIHFPEENPWFLATDEYFYTNTTNKIDGLSPWCKRCSSVRAYINILENYDRFLESYDKYTKGPKHKAYRKKNHATQVEKGQIKTWWKNNPEKLKQYNENHREHDIEESEWIANQEFFNNECAYCGLPKEKHIVIRNGKEIIMEFHKEHKDHEGYNDIRNCVPACGSCNSGKCRKTIDEFFETGFVEGFTQERYDKIIQWTTEEYKKYITDKPPYIIRKRKNEYDSKFHHELWSVDEMRNLVEILAVEVKKKDLDVHIQKLFPTL